MSVTNTAVTFVAKGRLTSRLPTCLLQLVVSDFSVWLSTSVISCILFRQNNGPIFMSAEGEHKHTHMLIHLHCPQCLNPFASVVYTWNAKWCSRTRRVLFSSSSGEMFNRGQALFRSQFSISEVDFVQSKSLNLKHRHLRKPDLKYLLYGNTGFTGFIYWHT